jgi:hypothetical protein
MDAFVKNALKKIEESPDPVGMAKLFANTPVRVPF